MNRIGWLFCVVIFLGSCSKSSMDFTPETKDFKTYEGHIEQSVSMLADSSLSYSYEIINGYSRVFEVDYAQKQYNDIYDDEYGEHLVFQIPTSLDTFSLKNEELIASNCFFNKWGAWTSHYIYRISEGNITGQRIDDQHWSVYIDIYTSPVLNEEVNHIVFEGIFVEE